MTKPKNKKPSTASHGERAEYRGKQTKTGNSSGFRFEGAGPNQSPHQEDYS
jgi:hypothetical protein